jgi:hypothetical protein
LTQGTAHGGLCSTKGAANDCGSPPPVADVKINEVESSGGSPGAWVELRNNGAATADVSGYRLIDNDSTHAQYAIPSGTTIPAGGYRRRCPPPGNAASSPVTRRPPPPARR